MLWESKETDKSTKNFGMKTVLELHFYRPLEGLSPF